VVRDAVRFYIAYHRQADGIDGCYLHDPVTLIGALLRPDLVTETMSERLACETGADPHLAGSLSRSTDAERAPVEVALAVDGDGMKEELLARLARAVSTATP
jgi:inosine-uridine nucleoside N-ribohydrolase